MVDPLFTLDSLDFRTDQIVFLEYIYECATEITGALKSLKREPKTMLHNFTLHLASETLLLHTFKHLLRGFQNPSDIL